MNIIVFGSTGSVGRHIVRQALDEGHRVTAFARNPEQLGMSHELLTTVHGDVLVPATIIPALRGQDVVMCSIGAGRKGGLRSEGTRNIVQAMQAVGVRRLICQTTLGVGESWGNLNLLWKTVMFRGLLRRAFDDHVRQEEIVRSSGLDWTIVRPGAFTDGERTGRYHIGFPGTDRSVELRISRSDVADAMLRMSKDDQFLHADPGLSY